MVRELVITGVVAVLAVVLWQLGVVARVRVVLVELDRLTVKDDGESM